MSTPGSSWSTSSAGTCASGCGRALTPREALQFAAAIARALDAVHGAGVLHRDLKPGNIMLRADGSIALIDFGMSKDAALTLDITETGTIFGTPHYMSPEQGHAEPLDERSDLYSLGVILFEMLTRQKPFRAENPMAIVYKHRKAAIPQLPAKFAPVAAGAGEAPGEAARGPLRQRRRGGRGDRGDARALARARGRAMSARAARDGRAA